MSSAYAAARGRRAAEREMTDVCTITVPSDEEPVMDDETGIYPPVARVTLYSGRCRVRQPDAGREVEAGEAVFNISDRVVSIPLTSSGYAVVADRQVRIPTGAIVTLTAIGPSTDPDLLDATLTYLSPTSQGSHPTARRLLCRRVD